MGAAKIKEKPTAVPFCSVKTCSNFHMMLPSTVEEFTHFVRSWKIVAEFYLLTTVIRTQELGQVFMVGRNRWCTQHDGQSGGYSIMWSCEPITLSLHFSEWLGGTMKWLWESLGTKWEWRGNNMGMSYEHHENVVGTWEHVKNVKKIYEFFKKKCHPLVWKIIKHNL